MTVTGTIQSVTETAGGMTIRIVTGYTLPPVIEPIVEVIGDVRPEWARVALRGAIGKSVTVTTNEAGDVTMTTVRA